MSTCREGSARRSGSGSSTSGSRVDSVRASAIAAAWTAALAASELQDFCLGGKTGDCDNPEDPRCETGFREANGAWVSTG
jgi:hypothetical protein